MPLRECMAAHTHREYLAWMAWLDEEWNRPSRGDYYLMQVAAEVFRICCVIVGKRRQIKLGDFQVRFGPPAEQRQMTIEEATAMSKAVWGARLKGTKTL